MNFNFVSHLETCYNAVQQNTTLLYYSHIPTAIIILFVGFFVLSKNRSLLSKILFGITVTFSLWIILNLIVWTNYNSELIMFSWAVLNVFDVLFYVLCFYFVYVFIEKKDVSFGVKMIISLILSLIVIFSLTTYHLQGFFYNDCVAIEGEIFLDVIFYIELGISFAIIFFCISKYIFAGRDDKRQILVLMFGMSVFLLSFFVAGYLADYYGEYDIELYGLFGIIIFMASLAYLIVQHSALDIKLARAQALVWSLIFLIGAQFFFIRNPTNQVLNSIAFVLVCFVGYGVVKSVKREEQQNDRLIHFSKELTRANAELKKLDSAKSEFISIASHQLRTPLTAIKGYISLILEGAYGTNAERTDDALNKIFLANERLIQLVEDMLNLTRIESGRLDYHLESNVQVEEILSELKDMFILRAKDKGLELTIMESEKLTPLITADKSKLREVISNLMDNAIKYTKQGFVRVSAEPIGNVVRITIADSGMGISEESIKTLFTKFSRGTDSTKVYTDGSGLGLYVGKNLIESQGGHIYIESDGVDKGSRFIIEMPIKRDNVVMDQEKRSFVEGDGIKQ